MGPVIMVYLGSEATVHTLGLGEEKSVPLAKDTWIETRPALLGCRGEPQQVGL